MGSFDVVRSLKIHEPAENLYLSALLSLAILVLISFRVTLSLGCIIEGEGVPSAPGDAGVEGSQWIRYTPQSESELGLSVSINIFAWSEGTGLTCCPPSMLLPRSPSHKHLQTFKFRFLVLSHSYPICTSSPPTRSPQPNSLDLPSRIHRLHAREESYFPLQPDDKNFQTASLFNPIERMIYARCGFVSGL